MRFGVASLAWFLIEGFVGMASCWAVEIILQLRVYAIYDQNPKIKRFLIATFLLQVVGVVIIFTIGALVESETLMIEMVQGHNSDNTRCKVVHVPNLMCFFWVTLACHECLLGALVISKGVQHAKQLSYSGSFRKLRGGEGLHEILIRDSVVYYVGIILIYTINLILWIQEITDAFDLATSLAVVYPSLMGSHLMFNIRRVHQKSLMGSLVSSPSTMSLPPFPIDLEREEG
ncbi:hypothetical protein D9758_010346 [Tetrapyrgos nigripes]|uniref:Uncharacterized protein n=1 Tax=Tetrapyrgos nigripes TaxID=182062 RepID=A0A8H5FVR1_9AGAR|nr:hypothetical protein D9758_010346 [Tetrapyrgos nigripes]